jgi:trehalose 6-phosphate phosphatase
MRHLFRSWPEFVKDAKGTHLLLLADYDGTLTPIAPRPVDAVLSTEVRDKLITLAKKPGLSVGVISGRDIVELKSMVGVKGIYYAGNHGLQIEGPGLKYVIPGAEVTRRVIAGLAGELKAALKNISGVIIQEKGLSLSVHYRLVKPEEVKAVTGEVRRITAGRVNRGEIKVYPMKRDWEIRPPVDWDKGKSVETIADSIKTKLKSGRLLTVFLGDDVTDEDAFRVVKRPDGWSVYVGAGNKASAAGYYLKSPGEVETLLGRLIDLE